MEVCRKSSWLLLLLGVIFLATALQGVQGEAESEGPSESECRPYIEKALKELEAGEAGDDDSKEDVPTVEITTDDSDHDIGDGDDDAQESAENEAGGDPQSSEKAEQAEDDGSNEESVEEAQADDDNSAEAEEAAASAESKEAADDDQSDEKQDDEAASAEAQAAEAEDADSKESDGADSKQEDDADSKEAGDDAESKEAGDDADSKEGDDGDSTEAAADDDSKEVAAADDDSKEAAADDDSTEAAADADSKEAAADDDSKEAAADDDNDDSKEQPAADVESAENDDAGDSQQEEAAESKETEDENKEESAEDAQEASAEQNAEPEKVDDSKEASAESNKDDDDSKEDDKAVSKEDDKADSKEEVDAKDDASKETDDADGSEEKADVSEESGEPVEEDLTQETEVPDDLRPREHIAQLLKLDDESVDTEKIVNRVADITLRELKKLYENAIKPLEVLYKYRDLSNRHFGDSEIFSKPLVLFMGPWSGGKSSIINYLLDNEYNETSLRTGAEPSPAYFNLLMYGEEPEVLDGTQLAADYTFSGLQKFGQGLEERLKGHKLPSKLLQKINIVEIPGILEVRKQVSRVFPFNDACQWFIDRADIIFLVYDPSKLDVGPETEAILDQLKGREHQTRIVLNKADQVKPEELMRVQGALIWNISPLMSSAQPPIMYTTSLWSRPYESWAPVRLLQAQERAFLRDLRSAYDKRIENKIASARRFAVRVRNHAKMVDCYLTTYYNHKSVFGNRKQVADEIIEHPQDYHIYEGLSTLTNISRYDLPDPDVYRDFFKLNPLYEFQQLSATCTYFRGCPINRLDVAIAYDLPELVGKHKRMVESALAEAAAPGS